MPGFNPEKLNIHDLTVEEPEKQAEVFDADKEITESDWKLMKDGLEALKGADSFKRYIELAANMKVLNPELELEINDNIKQEIDDLLEDEEDDENWIGIGALAMDVKILDPGFNINQKTWRKMRGELDELRRDKNWLIFSSHASKMKFINPSADLGLDETAWQAMKEELESNRSKKLWSSFFIFASNMRILNPNMDFGIDEDAWQGMREKLEIERGSPSGFSEAAIRMKIVSAGEIKITDKGLEITASNKNFESETPQMPEQRNF